jgi:hypothetical protein
LKENVRFPQIRNNLVNYYADASAVRRTTTGEFLDRSEMIKYQAQYDGSLQMVRFDIPFRHPNYTYDQLSVHFLSQYSGGRNIA